MRILLDARMIRHPGIGRYLQGLLRHLSFTSHDWLVCGDPAVLEHLPFGAGVKIVLARSPIYSVAEQWELARLVGAFRVDLIHVPHFNFPWHLPTHCRLVGTVHDLIYLEDPQSRLKGLRRWYVDRCMRYLAQKASRIITVSEFTRQAFLRWTGCSPEKVVTIHSAVDDRFLVAPDPNRVKGVRQRLGLPERYLLWVSAIKPHKDLFTLLKAFARLMADGLPHGLVVVGQPDRRQRPVEEQARWAGIPPDRIRAIAWLETEDLAVLYRLADLFVVTSRCEGFGFPPLEAMASGTPVVAASAGALPEVLGDAAYWFLPGDVDGLMRTIYNVLYNTELRQTLVQRGKQQVGRYRWADTARKTQQVYEEVLSQDRPGP
jgi:glycosyltransferase involved in cell wall biosynthesis